MATATFTFSGVTSAQKRTLVAAALGWGLDGFDVMLYSMVLPVMMKSLGLPKRMGVGRGRGRAGCRNRSQLQPSELASGFFCWHNARSGNAMDSKRRS